MQIDAVDEFNKDGHLIYSSNYIGAYVRGKTREEALRKFPFEIAQYCRWLGTPSEDKECTISVIQEKQSNLQICDADSDVLFESEIAPLTMEEYKKLYALAMKSAMDFETLYRSVPIKDKSAVPPRKTFYGMIPTTAQEMYDHTKNVNNYYFGEIHIPAENEPDIYTCRLRAFGKLEEQPDFLNNTVFDGSYGEQWSLRKVCRRFVWHDRIHAKAMFRAAVKLCGKEDIANPFCFIL
ncbi:MAG: hypothetical protein F9K45_12325 [Melioribacteraceae bacterium]|nr:MAG: hypothetical protein F9K45_12325 [Melioribacteraceae bacterium]